MLDDAARQRLNTVAKVLTDRPALLQAVCRLADVPKPRNLVGLATEISQEQMKVLLLAAQPVSADALRGLAVARRMAMKDNLATRELPESRLFFGRPGMGLTW